jgi:hypothetical protein
VRHRPHTHALFAAWAASGRGLQGDGRRTIVPSDTCPALKSPPNFVRWLAWLCVRRPHSPGPVLPSPRSKEERQ